MMKHGSSNSWLTKWVILLSQYDITFMLQRAVKGQVIADFLAKHPIPKPSKLYEDISDEVIESNVILDHQIWQLYFNSASRCSYKGVVIVGVGVVLIDPYGHVLPWAYSLTKPCSNNVAEYNALIISLQLAKVMGAKYLKVHSDSKLIVNQIKGEYEVRHNDLMPYHKVATKLAQSFEGFYISYITHLKITHAKALASLAATLALVPKSTRCTTMASH
ncbi:uncharacterized protein LOC109838892 [Asparagus officinalis]|uniref:uncharacterized protein LOC109838892 n=1 Tax=Asparagus officinalis TaxID=4686 RepID=UPI00098E75D4|nr:uncharacterized protein LOC109838892 [Asparagus officinalis]